MINYERKCFEGEEQSVCVTHFISKLSISQKECSETIYWLELLHESDYITNDSFESINHDAIEIMKLLTASIKTMKSKLNR